MELSQGPSQVAQTSMTGRQSQHLSQQQIDFYNAKGYLVFENVLTRAELHELREGSECLQEERKRLGGEVGLAAIQNVPLMHEAFMRMACHPFMLTVVSSLIGQNLRLQHAKLNWKPPAYGAGEVAWHQDFPHFPHSNYDLLACMFLLDDATPENGCLRVIPGSHKRGPVDHYDANGKFQPRCTEPRDYEADL